MIKNHLNMGNDVKRFIFIIMYVDAIDLNEI